jgi:hypothetical protein
MSTHVLVWDLETIPDLRGFAAANGQNPMPATTHSGRCGCGSFRFRDVMVIIGFPMGSLRRKNSQGRQTSRSAGDAANQVRADGQSQDREDPRPEGSEGQSDGPSLEVEGDDILLQISRPTIRRLNMAHSETTGGTFPDLFPVT